MYKKGIYEIRSNEPLTDAVIHCAAWTAVDLAEDADKQPKVRAINVDGTAHLAAACKAQDCKMMYISTDYVFNGQGQTPWQYYVYYLFQLLPCKHLICLELSLIHI